MPLPEYDDVRTYTPENPDLVPYRMGRPQRIIVHRQGNPGATAENALRWMDRNGLSVHYYCDQGVVWRSVPPEGLARHVGEFRVAHDRGYPIASPPPLIGLRGDIQAIGIETVDSDNPVDLGHGQTVGLSQRTRQTLVRLCAELCRLWNLSPEVISEHATWDPWQRPHDLGEALYIPDLQADVADFLAGREPWRVVGPYAFGTPNTSGGPVQLPPAPEPPAPPLPLPVPPAPLDRLRHEIGMARSFNQQVLRLIEDAGSAQRNTEKHLGHAQEALDELLR